MRTGFLAETSPLLEQQYPHLFMKEPLPHIEELKATDLLKVL